MANKKRRARRYNPRSLQQRLSNEIASTTFFYHLSSMGTASAQAGNYKFPLSKATADYIINRKNTWAGMIAVFCEWEGEQYVKTMFFSIDTHIDRAELCDKVDAMQLELVHGCNPNHLCSAGFFIVPDHLVDVEAQREEILSLFEQHTPYSYTITALASLVRQKQLDEEQQSNMKEIA